MDISKYHALTPDELRDELISTVHDLVYTIREHATLSADYHGDFLRSWAQSAGGNVSAKDRDAEFQNKDVMEEIISRKGMIEALTAQRDLLLCLIK
jgi:hypothetical protein